MGPKRPFLFIASVLLICVTLSACEKDRPDSGDDSYSDSVFRRFSVCESAHPSVDSYEALDLSGFVSSFQMIDECNGWGYTFMAHAYELWRTWDGGETWFDVMPAHIRRANGVGLFVLDAYHAWVLAGDDWSENVETVEAELWHTKDGGLSWEQTAVLPFARNSGKEAVPELYFLDANRGWMYQQAFAGLGYSYDLIWQTMDGGRTWQQVVGWEGGESESFPQTGNKSNLVFLDEERGWFAMDMYSSKGISPSLFETTDGGSHWTIRELPVPELDFTAHRQFSFPAVPIDDQSVHVFLQLQDEEESHFAVVHYATNDRGETWAPIAGWRTDQSMSWTDGERGTGAGFLIPDSRDQIIRYDGNQWNTVAELRELMDEEPQERAGIWHANFVDGQNGWAAAGEYPHIHLYRTWDGGQSWHRLGSKFYARVNQ